MLRFLVLLVLIGSTNLVVAGDKLPLRVLYLGNDLQRSSDFEKFLEGQFVFAMAQSHDSFAREVLVKQDIDVVVLDWSQRETSSKDAVSPLGDRETWSTPTVLLGSAGHLLSAAWEVAGGSG